ncbi:MAG: hypothetical protein ACHQF2_10615 [Flavobacteriales bacterium]
MLRLTSIMMALSMLASCGNGKEKALSLEKKNRDSSETEVPDSLRNYIMNRSEVYDCMLNAIYYKLKVTREDLDTIKTHYFHNIVDYQDLEVRVMSERLQRLREIMKDSAKVKSFIPQRYEKEMDSLVQEVNRYEKSVVGFVLVHTFFIKADRDTQTMIFVLDKNCGYKDAIKIKSISNLNPEDYVNSFRNF